MIDLHHHFDGAFSIEGLYKEAKRRNLPQGKFSFEEFTSHCQVKPESRSLTDFLAVFDFFYGIAQDIDFLHNEALSLPQRMEKQGVLYLETRFAPHLFTGTHYSAENIVEAVVSGLEKNSGAPVRLILCVMRNAPTTTVQEIIDLYEKFKLRGVCGIDLAGDESRFACREYAPFFTRAHEQKIPITIHAGEASGAHSVYDALNLFHAQRLGHGIRSIDDAALVSRLRDEKIGVEVCLTSNLQTGNSPSYKEHPFLKLFRAGVKVTINTDDPSVSGIDLPHEWKVAEKEFGLTKEDKERLLLNSVEVAFCSDALKENLRKQVLSYSLNAT
ncbi:MAG: Adenosine deaminase [Turneriella sp.]|nr:Adenosine deaminase [Turneriella sp.]